jgi:sec-independent protein translocase protein TatC
MKALPRPAPREEELTRMSFLDHLEDLRRCLIRSLMAVLVAFLGCWYISPQLFELVARPVEKALPKGQHLAYTTLAEPFLLYFRVALIAGIIAASPVILWQLWRFISPGLYSRERRLAVPFVVFTALFFISGVIFGYLVAFPMVVKFLIGVGKNFTPVITINEYLSMAAKTILGLGLCFELPILIFFLARLGIVTERFLLAKFKYAVLIIFIIAAIITPTPDAGTQCAFALPMIGLYLLGIGIAWLFRKREART